MKKEICRRLNGNVADFENAAKRFVRAPHAADSALHDLRVALRSLRAGVRVLAGASDSPSLRHLSEELRRVSRATSVARDEQVLEEMLSGSAMSAWVKKRNSQRRRSLEAVCKRLRHDNPKVLAEKMRVEINMLINQASRKSLEQAVCKRASKDERKLACDSSHIKKMKSDSSYLHGYRIRTKKLRYTIKVFEPALSKRCRRLVPLTKKTQDALGKVHDFDQAIALIKKARGVTRYQESLNLLCTRRERAVKAALVSIKEMRSYL
jgi:CHAD domain-containing protein